MGCNCIKCRAELAVVVPDDVYRLLAVRRGFQQLLSNPELRRMSSDVEVNDPPRMQFDDEEDVKVPKDKIDNRGEITCLDLREIIERYAKLFLKLSEFLD